MATMISEVYDALIAAGAPEDKARSAAETLADYQNRFETIERGPLKLQGDMVLLRWMIGFVIALNIAILVRVFFA